MSFYTRFILLRKQFTSCEYNTYMKNHDQISQKDETAFWRHFWNNGIKLSMQFWTVHEQDRTAMRLAAIMNGYYFLTISIKSAWKLFLCKECVFVITYIYYVYIIYILIYTIYTYIYYYLYIRWSFSLLSAMNIFRTF